MIRNYINVAIRNLLKHKFYTGINILVFIGYEQVTYEAVKLILLDKNTRKSM